MRNAPTTSSSPAQIRDTSDLEIPDSTPKRGDQIVDRAGRHPVDVGLHHHRVERLVDPPARLQDPREEAALAQLGDPQLDVAGLGRHQPRPGAVAFGDAAARCVRNGRRRSARSLRSRSAPASPAARRHGSDRRRRRRGTRPTVRTGQTGTGPSVASPQCVLAGTHRESRRWPHPVVDPAGYLKAHHAAGRTPTKPTHAGESCPTHRTRWKNHIQAFDVAVISCSPSGDRCRHAFRVSGIPEPPAPVHPVNKGGTGFVSAPKEVCCGDNHIGYPSTDAHQRNQESGCNELTASNDVPPHRPAPGRGRVSGGPAGGGGPSRAVSDCLTPLAVCSEVLPVVPRFAAPTAQRRALRRSTPLQRPVGGSCY